MTMVIMVFRCRIMWRKTYPAKLLKLNSQFHTFCTKRFDRIYNKKIFYASALTMLNTKQSENISYLDIAFFISCNNFKISFPLLFSFIIKISPFLIFYHGKIFYLHRFIYRLFILYISFIFNKSLYVKFFQYF